MAHIYKWSVESEVNVRAPDEKQVAALFGLQIGLELRPLAADFYLLYDLSLDGQDNGLFAPLLHELTYQFTTYTDMILGGELRYIVGHWNGTTKLDPRFIEHMCLPGQGKSDTRLERSTMWLKWHTFRAMYHTDALTIAYDTFNAFNSETSKGVGGPAWANIADILRRFERHELTPTMFVDFCWGLQHNGGTYFNKLWPSARELITVLNAKRASDYQLLSLNASQYVQELWREVHGT